MCRAVRKLSRLMYGAFSNAAAASPRTAWNLTARLVRDVLEQQHFVSGRGVAIGDRGQRLDVDLDQAERVLGNAGSVGEHERDRLADIAHLRLRDHRLAEPLEFRQRLQPHRHARHALADVPGGDHAVHACERERRRSVDRADAAMRDRAAQHRRMQQPFAREIIDKLAAPAHEAQVLQALDRAADERVDRSHVRSPCL